MKNIYDIKEFENICQRQKHLIAGYVLAVICFIGILTLGCFTIENNILLTVFFSLLLLFFILSSIVFWKVKYFIIHEHKLFMDNMEMGNKSDFAGYFVGKETAKDENENFDTYLFISSNKKTSFLIHRQYSADFTEGEKYHVEHVGSYIYRWERIK